VFLALAIGIVLGSTELRGAVLNKLNSATTSLSNDLAARKAQIAALQQQVNGDQAFAQAAESRLLGGLLTGQRVVLVAAPGAPGQVTSGVSSALVKAGATVTGQVNLQPKLFDASQNTQQELSSLVQTLVAPGSTTPANGSALQQAAHLLGSAILTRSHPSGGSNGTSAGKQSANGQAVLSSYAQAGLLSVTGQPANPATLAVVITPASPPASGSDPLNQGLITLAQQLSTASLGTVVASSISGSVAGSAIDALRGSSAAAQISSVDDADTLTGQIVTVQALAQALAGHKAGAYGIGPGNTAAGPSPAPTPAAAVATGQLTGAQAARVHNASGRRAAATATSSGGQK
jgi:hypothetical protein